MTRETKAGLVVSCSFLCLVGVVLFYKIREKDGTPPETSDTDSGELATTTTQPAPEAGQRHRHKIPKVAAPSSKEATKPEEVTKPGESVRPGVPGRIQIGEDHKNTYPAPPPSLPGTSQTKELPASPPGQPDIPSTKPPTPVIKLDPVDTIRDDQASATTFNEDPSKHKGPSSSPHEASSPTQESGEPYAPKSASQTEMRGNGNELPSGVPPAQVRRTPRPLFQLAQPPPAAATAALDLERGSPGTKEGSTAGVPEPPKLDTASSSPSVTPRFPNPTDARASASDDGAISGERSSASTVSTVVSPSPVDRGTVPDRPQASAPAGDDAPEGRLRSSVPPPPPAQQAAQVPNSTQAELASAGGSPTRPLPALGTPAAPVPPVAGAAAVIPQVESYDEETYTCKPNDTFRTISRDFYQTERYERALWLFNRNHPLATEGVRQDPPLLQSGQPVYIPPIRILERYYSGAILDSAMPARATGQAPANPQSPGTIRQVNGSAANSANRDERIYRVRGDGELFADIARLTLGSGERWIEIYRLNPRFNPKYPVPAGSELRLPADARVEPVAPQ